MSEEFRIVQNNDNPKPLIPSEDLVNRVEEASRPANGPSNFAGSMKRQARGSFSHLGRVAKRESVLVTTREAMKTNAQLFGNIQSGAVMLNREDEISSYKGKAQFFIVINVLIMLVTAALFLIFYLQ